jgi:hypothetical protein
MKPMADPPDSRLTNIFYPTDVSSRMLNLIIAFWIYAVKQASEN